MDYPKVVYPFYNTDTGESGYKAVSYSEWEQLCESWEIARIRAASHEMEPEETG